MIEFETDMSAVDHDGALTHHISVKLHLNVYAFITSYLNLMNEVIEGGQSWEISNISRYFGVNFHRAVIEEAGRYYD